MGGGGTASESEYYLGSIFHSLEHLPQWYQLFALFGVFFFFFLREIAVVGWLASALHHSFGTGAVWSVGYQRLLEQMTFNERLCLTLYGVALLLLAAAAYRLFGRDALQVGLQESGLRGGRRWGPAVVVGVVLGAEGVALLREEAARALADPASLAHLALAGFGGGGGRGLDPRLASGNPHLIIQMEILKALLVAFVERVGPAVFLAGCYRLMRDVPRKAHAALRWYIVTLMLSRSLVALYIMYRNNDWERQSSWILFISSLSFLGIVNYAFGPSKRGGWTATTSVVASISQTIQGITKCTAIFFVIYLSVLALVVSVHVVELILIWLIFSLTIIWIPAIIDSCSTDYMLSIATAICFLSIQMNYLTYWGSFRLWSLLIIWCLDISLYYNLATINCKSRYGGITAIFLFTIVIWRSLNPELQFNDFVSFLENIAEVLRDVVEGIHTVEEDNLSAPNIATNIFIYFFNTGILIGGLLIICIALIGICETKDVRTRLISQNIVILTPGVLFRKLVKTFIFAISFIIFLVAGLILYRILPQIATFAPDFMTRGIAVGSACMILGTLMDMQEFLYIGFMRLIGVMDPPEANDEDKEADQSVSFIGNHGNFSRRYTVGR